MPLLRRARTHRCHRPLPPTHHPPPLSLAQVEEIALLNTVLVRWDGARLWFPNARLNAESLLNLTRSNNKAESFKVRRRWGLGEGQARWAGRVAEWVGVLGWELSQRARPSLARCLGPHHTTPCPRAAQLSLDLGTPLEVVEMLRDTVAAHVAEHTAEFTGASSGGWAGVWWAGLGWAPEQDRTGGSAPCQRALGSQLWLSACLHPPTHPALTPPSKPSAVVVKALGDPMKLSLSIWYEYAHNGVDGGRVSRARCAPAAAAWA